MIAYGSLTCIKSFWVPRDTQKVKSIICGPYVLPVTGYVTVSEASENVFPAAVALAVNVEEFDGDPH